MTLAYQAAGWLADALGWLIAQAPRNVLRAQNAKLRVRALPPPHNLILSSRPIRPLTQPSV